MNHWLHSSSLGPTTDKVNPTHGNRLQHEALRRCARFLSEPGSKHLVKEDEVRLRFLQMSPNSLERGTIALTLPEPSFGFLQMGPNNPERGTS